MERLVPNSSIRQRKAISASEQPFLEAIAKVLDEHREYWPISLRRVHYSLLNQPVVRNARSGALYANELRVVPRAHQPTAQGAHRPPRAVEVDRGRFRQIICSFTRAS